MVGGGEGPRSSNSNHLSCINPAGALTYCYKMQSHISRRRVKASAAQLSCLAKHMQRHPEMATSNMSLTLQGRANLEVLWHQLATKLNSLGGPIKTMFKWKQAWRDMRYNIKKKEFHKKQEFQEYESDRSGDGQAPGHEQSADDKVLSMICPVTVYDVEEIVYTEPTVETGQSQMKEMSSRTEPENKVEGTDSSEYKTTRRRLQEMLSASRKCSRVLSPRGTFHNRLLLIEKEKIRVKKKQNNILQEKNAILNR